MKKVSRILLLILVGITLLAYLSVWVSPATFKYAAGISIFIPLLLLINLFTGLVMLLRRSKRAIIPIVLLVLGYPFFMVGISFGADNSEPAEGLKVLSYNVKAFVSFREYNTRDVFDYIAELEADINCFQEFSNQDKYVQKLKGSSKYFLAYNHGVSNLAIVSKHPVIQHGLLLEDRKYNNILYADLLIDKKDTIRIYNVHLESMGITHTNPDYYGDLATEYDEAKAKFLNGAVKRAEQIEILLSHAANCHYPLMIVGDFNDVPFSYNYFKVRRSYNNSFEKAGSGFGFTYNGDLPFLRIDNQFFNEGFEVNSFVTLDSVVYSDHYPTLGIYSISD